jgi:molecular chaperone DnaK
LSYQLGIDLGTTFTAAATTRDGQTRIVELGGRGATVPSVIFLKEDETILAGEPADRRAQAEPGRVAREFKRRIGDPTPIILGGVPYSADRLASALLKWVVETVTEREGGPPDAITITFPANWGPFKRDLLEQAIHTADIAAATILTEPEAAAIYYASLERVDTGTIISVFDLGGGTFDTVVLRKTPEGFEVLGRPEGIERLGGIDFDEAVFSHVRASLEGVIEALDPDDPAALAAIGRLRRDCVDAKEALSSDTEAIIPVLLPALQTEVRITRAEFEAMIRPRLSEAIDATRRSFKSAIIEAEEVTAVLLVGGSSRIPLVAQMVAAGLGRPISLDVHPKHAVALGAAMATGRNTQPLTTSPTATPPIATPPVTAPPTPRTEPMAKQPASPRELSTLLSERKGLIVGVAAAVILVLAVAAFLSGGDESPGDKNENPLAATTTTEVVAATAPATTAAPPTTAPTTTMPATTTSTSATTTSTTATTTTLPQMPLDLEAVRLVSITLNGNVFVVTYEANFNPLISSDPSRYHLHFFWDTYDPATVGSNEPSATRGDWQIWDTDSDGEWIFDDWLDGEAPFGATSICAVPATSTHAVANVERVAEAFDCILLPSP